MLSPDVVRQTAPVLRRSALVGAGRVPARDGPRRAGAGGAAALAHPAPGRPARAGARPAGRGGAAGRRRRRGARSSGGRGLLAGGEDAAADGMRGLLPEPVDHVLAQPDLSLDRPGAAGGRPGRHAGPSSPTWSPPVARRSTGSPTGSIRRALDSGWSARRPARLLRPRLAHPGAAGPGVPDRRRRAPARPAAGRRDRVLRPLRRPRAGVSQVLSDRRTANAELRRLAPGVLVSSLAAGGGAGRCCAAPATPRRGVRRWGGADPARGAGPRGRPPPGRGPPPGGPRPLAPGDVAATVREIRAGDAALAARRTEPVRQVPGVTTAGTLELLHPRGARGPARVAGLRRRPGQREPADRRGRSRWSGASCRASTRAAGRTAPSPSTGSPPSRWSTRRTSPPRPEPCSLDRLSPG